MKHYMLKIAITFGLILLLHASSVATAIDTTKVGVQNGDTFSLKVTSMTGLLAQYQNEDLTAENYSLYANETVSFKVIDAVPVKDAISVDVTTHQDTFNVPLNLTYFGSPIIYTDWVYW